MIEIMGDPHGTDQPQISIGVLTRGRGVCASPWPGSCPLRGGWTLL